MSESNASAPRGDEAFPEQVGEPLQFDQAEFATPAGDGPACTACHQPIDDEYFELGGKVFCANCRQTVEANFRGGSRLARVFKALILGSIAAALGSVLYYTIIRLTGWNIGIVAVLIGLMVGGAVRRGSGNRGGLGYQFLAVFLTYSSIVAMIIPAVLEGFANQAKEQEARNLQQAKAMIEKVERDQDQAKAKQAPGDGSAPVRKAETKPGPVVAAGTAEDPKEAAGQADAVGERLPREPLRAAPDPGLVILTVFIVIAFTYSIPVRMAIAAPLSGLIFGFALWEAWKLNRRLVLAFNGPFRLGKPDTDPTFSEVVGDGA
jgi:hypothetical protein